MSTTTATTSLTQIQTGKSGKPKPTLNIHPAPFKPSRLSIQPSPITPRTPLTPFARPRTPTHRANQTTSTPSSSSSQPHNPSTKTPPHPVSPLQWLWQCHLSSCRRTYPLGTTRRCLEDGHYFCAGRSAAKKPWRSDGRRKRAKRGGACRSEFDYEGWKEWGRWRRRVERERKNVGRRVRDSIYEEDYDGNVDDEVRSESSCGDRVGYGSAEKNCWMKCNYPSECRWGRLYGVHTPEEAEFPVIDLTPEGLASSSDSSSTTSSSSSDSPSLISNVAHNDSSNDFNAAANKKNIINTTFDAILGPQPTNTCKHNTSTKESSSNFSDVQNVLQASWAMIKRKEHPPPSPLASHPVSADVITTTASQQQATPESGETGKDKDGDVIMETVDPKVLSLVSGPLLKHFDTPSSEGSKRQAHDVNVDMRTVDPQLLSLSSGPLPKYSEVPDTAAHSLKDRVRKTVKRTLSSGNNESREMQTEPEETAEKSVAEGTYRSNEQAVAEEESVLERGEALERIDIGESFEEKMAYEVERIEMVQRIDSMIGGEDGYNIEQWMVEELEPLKRMERIDNGYESS